MKNNLRKILVLITLLIWTTDTAIALTTNVSTQSVDLYTISAEYIPSRAVRFCNTKANMGGRVAATRHIIPVKYQLGVYGAHILSSSWDNIPTINIGVIADIIIGAYEIPIIAHSDSYADNVFETCMFRALIANPRK